VGKNKISYNGSQINAVKDMKRQILEIADELSNDAITPQQAQTLLLRLFVVSGSLQLTDEQTKVLADLGSGFVYEGVKDDLRISEFGILEIFHKWKELLSNDR
jgi:hypothetical protein